MFVQALLKVVADCSVVALNPRRDAINESPLKIALFSLVKMCAYPLCRQFIRSSELFPIIAQLRQSPESTIANYASVVLSKASEVWCQWNAQCVSSSSAYSQWTGTEFCISYVTFPYVHEHLYVHLSNGLPNYQKVLILELILYKAFVSFLYQLGFSTSIGICQFAT